MGKILTRRVSNRLRTTYIHPGPAGSNANSRDAKQASRMSPGRDQITCHRGTPWHDTRTIRHARQSSYHVEVSVGKYVIEPVTCLKVPGNKIHSSRATSGWPKSIVVKGEHRWSTTCCEWRLKHPDSNSTKYDSSRLVCLAKQATQTKLSTNWKQTSFQINRPWAASVV
jgi:hypothetical protein